MARHQSGTSSNYTRLPTKTRLPLLARLAPLQSSFFYQVLWIRATDFMLGATQHNLPGFEHQANRITRRPECPFAPPCSRTGGFRVHIEEGCPKLRGRRRTAASNCSFYSSLIFGGGAFHGPIFESFDSDRASSDTRQLRTVWFTSRTMAAMAGAVIRCSPASSTICARVRSRTSLQAVEKVPNNLISRVNTFFPPKRVC